MRMLSGSDDQEFIEAGRYIRQAAEIAGKSVCSISRRGVVIVKNGNVIGIGYNGPNTEWPKELGFDCSEEGCRYNTRKECYGLHAEMRAILNAPRDELQGADLYHVKIDSDGEIESSRHPSVSACSYCAPHMLEAGIGEIFLSYGLDDGEPTEIGVYTAEEYFRHAFKIPD